MSLPGCHYVRAITLRINKISAVLHLEKPIYHLFAWKFIFTNRNKEKSPLSQVQPTHRENNDLRLALVVDVTDIPELPGTNIRQRNRRTLKRNLLPSRRKRLGTGLGGGSVPGSISTDTTEEDSLKAVSRRQEREGRGRDIGAAQGNGRADIGAHFPGQAGPREEGVQVGRRYEAGEHAHADGSAAAVHVVEDGDPDGYVLWFCESAVGQEDGFGALG